MVLEEEEEETPSSNKSAKRLGQPLAKRSRSVANQSGGVARRQRAQMTSAWQEEERQLRDNGIDANSE